MRDALAGLSNLDHLLRSMKVGPKALEQAIPAVLSGIKPCTRAAEELLDTLRRHANDAGVDALNELHAYLGERLVELTTGLTDACEQRLSARRRLQLESLVGRRLPELEAARDLLDVLLECMWAPSLPLPLADLLGDALSADFGSGIPQFRATVGGDLDIVEVDVPPGVLSFTLALLTGEYMRLHAASPHIQVTDSEAGVLLTLQPKGSEGRPLAFAARPVIDPACRILELALRSRGGHLSQGEPTELLLPTKWQAAINAS